MNVFHQYGTKERLFEMLSRVNRLDEEILPKEERSTLINSLIDFACEYLNINKENLNIEISYDSKEAQEMSSFGKHTPADGVIKVVAANRNLADVLRTLAHELVHHKQHAEGRLYVGAGEDGSDIENEANAEAAIIMRKFGKANPSIFE